MTPQMAKQLEFYLIQNGYVDVDRKVVEKLPPSKKRWGRYALASPNCSL